MRKKRPVAASGRGPAPGDLEIVRAFVNTIDIEKDEDELRHVPDAVRWLTKKRLLPRGARLVESEVRLLIRFRETLRDLALANHPGASDRGATAALNEIAEGVRLEVSFGSGGKAALVPALAGVDAVIGRLLSILYIAMTNGTFSRLKACQADTCRWAFYDRSKNRSSRWCQMAICGNREKARSYRRRRQLGTSSSVGRSSRRR